MKFLTLLAYLAVLVTAVSAWTKEDHEIFDLVSGLEAAEGRGTTFYSWLDILPTATTSEIAKAYRKKSILLHPDKNPGVKGIHERFARLGVIATILRNRESRERYDFFHKNGVPTWRGTGYYYSRFRPGLGFVLVFLTLLTSGLQYLIQHLNYKRDLGRIETVMRSAKLAAWGPKMTPLVGQRRVKVPLGGPRRLDDEGKIIEAKSLEMVVEPENIYIVEPTGGLHLLDPSAAVRPSITSTWFCALVALLYRKVVPAPKPTSTEAPPPPDVSDDETSSASENPASGTATPRDEDDTKGSKRVATVKAGGRRRKAVKKR